MLILDLTGGYGYDAFQGVLRSSETHQLSRRGFNSNWISDRANRCLPGFKNGSGLVLGVDTRQTCLKSTSSYREIAIVWARWRVKLESVDSCGYLSWWKMGISDEF